ncbi:MAG: ribosome silencing factor [Alphaproteobacteria bacterium]|nr:ribosome silencing factor [Alphaproteobacteria bacterium]
MKVPHAPAPTQAAFEEKQLPGLQEVLQTIESSLSEHKAQDIVSINLRGKTDVADAMVVASGISDRHVLALAQYVSVALKEIGITPLSIEGKESRNWVLVDLGDVVVHLFVPEARTFYNLEKMWDVVIPEQVETVE